MLQNRPEHMTSNVPFSQIPGTKSPVRRHPDSAQSISMVGLDSLALRSKPNCVPRSRNSPAPHQSLQIFTRLHSVQAPYPSPSCYLAKHAPNRELPLSPCQPVWRITDCIGPRQLPRLRQWILHDVATRQATSEFESRQCGDKDAPSRRTAPDRPNSQLHGSCSGSGNSPPMTQ